MYDQGYSALLEDLFQRGLLDNTLVANLAEFGRTPKNQSGRRTRPLAAMLDHLLRRRRCQGRQSRGKSDEIGAYPVERPVKPAEGGATIYHSLGLNLETHLPGPQSRPFPLVDYGTQPIRELF